MKQALLLLVVLGSHGTWAQPVDVEWLRTSGGYSIFHRHTSALDGTGHTYMVGQATDADFGNEVVVAGERMVLARYDSTGTIRWARAITDVPGEIAEVEAMATTSTGEVWVAGSFGTATLTIDDVVLSNQDGHPAFMARFDTTGAAQEVMTWGGMSNALTLLKDICTDAQDRVYVTGSSDASSMTIGEVTLTNTIAGSSQLYTLAFHADGTAAWGNLSASPNGSPRGYCVATDVAGKVYVAAYTLGDLVIDGITLPVANDTVALLRYDNTGVLEHMEAIATVMPFDLTVDDAGQAYLCGYYETTIILDNTTLEPSLVDGFVAAFPGDGTCAWFATVAGEEQALDACYSVALNAAHTQLIVGGNFSYATWFGPLFVDSPNAANGYIMHLDTDDGTVNWVKVMAGDGPTLYARALYGPADRIHTSGITESATTYLDEPVLVGNGNGVRSFVARFGEQQTGVPTIAQRDAPLPYPNPSNGTFTMDLPTDTRSVVIEDARGRVLQHVAVRTARPTTFHIRTPGVYTVKLMTATGSMVHRVVVQ